MSYEADDYLSRYFRTGGIDLARKVDELATFAAPGDSLNLALYYEMPFTVTRMAQTDRNRWGVKIMLQTLCEMEHAFSVLEQFKRRRKVIVLGSARTPVEHPVHALACELGEELARYDLMVITSIGGGIITAAHEGAGLENSLGFNITLPFEQHANHTINDSGNLLSLHFFFLRKLFFAKEANALVLCPGGSSILDEALEVLTLVQTGKSPLVLIVLLGQPGGRYWEHALEFMQEQLLENHYALLADICLMHLMHSAEDAVKKITQFCRNFHSNCWLKGTFVICLNHALNEAVLTHLHEHSVSLCLGDGLQQQAYGKQEQDEPELRNLTRLASVFNGRDQGRLQELLDYINPPENWD